VDQEKPPQINPCRIEDIPHLEAILQQTSEAASWSSSLLGEALTSHGSCFLVARQGKDIVGFIVGRRAMNEGEILNLAVVSRFRRQGFGKALVEQLLQIFGREGVVQAFLEVRQSNAAAITFYRRLGFRPVGERPAYYRNPTESALILVLALLSSGSTAGTN
jgi:ribosomal-protein-alanine N-acetyltransferase